MRTLSWTVAATAAALLAFGLGVRPGRLLGRMVRRLLAGLAALVLWNLALGGRGWAVGLNPFTAAVVAVLGTPGVLLLLALRIWGGP